MIDYLLGKPAAVQVLEALRPDGLAINVVTYGEVYQGVEDGRDPVAAEAAFRRFLYGVATLPIDEANNPNVPTTPGGLPECLDRNA